MVAPHETGDLVRSLVRVPGSGSDKSAGSEFLDLARASTLAASVPVPKTLPPALANPRAPSKPQESKTEKLVGKAGSAVDLLKDNAEDRKRLHPQESSESVGGTVPLPKRARVVYMTPDEVMNNASRIIPVATSAGPVLFMPLQPSTSNSSPLSLSEASVSQLIQERNNLRQENQMLHRQLYLFQQLFKDKKRLGSVVKRLGVKIP